MILIISACREKLHEYEFAMPIENTLKKADIKCRIVSYRSLKDKDLKKADMIIITGTSLKDSEFIKHLDKFSWIKKYEKPVLGICAGMQIISLVFGAKLKKKTEIGFYTENFTKEFLSMKEKHEVYHLHNNYATLPKDFENFTRGKIAQAIKHKTKKIYGVLFHPEVRNRKLIEDFAGL